MKILNRNDSPADKPHSAQRVPVTVRDYAAQVVLNVIHDNVTVHFPGIAYKRGFPEGFKAVSAIDQIIACGQGLFCKEIQIPSVNPDFGNAIGAFHPGELFLIIQLDTAFHRQIDGECHP